MGIFGTARAIGTLCAFALMSLLASPAATAPAAELPVAGKTCFGEPQIVAAAKVPGRFFPVEAPQVPAWLTAISQTADAPLPRADHLLVFIAAAPYTSGGHSRSPGSGMLFLTREGCLVWHDFLSPDAVLDLLDLVDQNISRPDLAQQENGR